MALLFTIAEKYPIAFVPNCPGFRKTDLFASTFFTQDVKTIPSISIHCYDLLLAKQAANHQKTRMGKSVYHAMI